MELSVLVVSNKKSTRSFASMFDHPLWQTADKQEKEKAKAHQVLKDRLKKKHETDLRHSASLAILLGQSSFMTTVGEYKPRYVSANKKQSSEVTKGARNEQADISKAIRYQGVTLNRAKTCCDVFRILM